MSVRNKQPRDTPRVWDPVYLRARHEAGVVLVAFVFWLFWTVGASWRLGYYSSSNELELILGFPSWVFWCVLVPWLTATIFSAVFALRAIREDDLGSTADTHEPAEGRGND